MKIAILGSTGNIGGLLTRMFTERGDTVYPLTRKDTLADTGYDVIVNCTGNAFLGREIFSVTEYYDKMVFNHLLYNPKTIVISFSSGVAGRLSFDRPLPQDYYALAKANSEAKHRAAGFNIIDIRLFSSFDHSFKRDKPFFINKVIDNLISKVKHIDTKTNIIRDYISAVDLFQVVNKCIEYGKNDVFEAYSDLPVNKMRILSEFADKFGFEYELKDFTIDNPYSGDKQFYTPGSFDAERIGYKPTISSLDNLISEVRIILNNK